MWYMPKEVQCSKDLSNHIVKDKHSEKTFQCSDCELTFSTKSNLKGHNDRVHKKITFGCASCGKYLSTKQKLKNHYQKCKSKTIIEDIEIVDPLPACNITPQKEFSEVFADFVLQSNDEIEEYPCDKCDKSFSNKNSLKIIPTVKFLNKDNLSSLCLIFH